MKSVVLICLVLGGAPEVEVTAIDGKTSVGSLVELNGERLTLQSAAGPVSLEVKQTAGFAARNPVAGSRGGIPVEVALADGSVLAAQDFRCEQASAHITLREGEVVSVTREHLAAVRLQPFAEGQAADWDRIRQTEATGDLLVVSQNGGTDFHRGVVGDVTDERVQFTMDGESFPVKRSKVLGLVFYHAAGAARPKTIAQITDASGSRWAVATLALNGQLSWTTPSGISQSRDLAQIARLDFARQGITYLGDLPPESTEWTPFFGPSAVPEGRVRLYSPRTDQNLDAQPLVLGGKQYSRGVAIHSRTLLVYRLPDRFQRFQATAGVDDSVRPRGNLRLVIQGDDRVLLDTAITGADAPVPIDLDIAGVRRISVLADFGEGMDVADHLVLGDARLVQ